MHVKHRFFGAETIQAKNGSDTEQETRKNEGRNGDWGRWKNHRYDTRYGNENSNSKNNENNYSKNDGNSKKRIPLFCVLGISLRDIADKLGLDAEFLEVGWS